MTGSGNACSMIRGNIEAGHPIPPCAGIGLRQPHVAPLLAHGGPVDGIGWLEVHSENYFRQDGRALAELAQLRQTYPLSLHGVGMSLGSADALNQQHLQDLKRLIETLQPALVSEHLSWSGLNGGYLNDLIPLPYTDESLQHMVDRIDQVQNFLQRRILIENVSGYLQFRQSHIPEHEFLVETAKRAGCGILLDINNVYVNAVNFGSDANLYIDAIPADLVEEIHLAGHTLRRIEEHTLLIDSHDQPVCHDVWSLYTRAVERIGGRPTLIEWDARLPALDILVAEAGRAQRLLQQYHEHAA